MAFEFPWKAYLELQKEKSKEKDTTWQDIVGQALATGGKVAGNALQNRKQKQLADQKKQQLGSAIDTMSQQNPALSPYAGVFKQDPSLMGQILPGLIKPQQQKPEYSPIPGFLSGGSPVLYDKFDPTKTQVLPIKGEATGGSQMAGVRNRQFGLQDLPSNQPSTSAGGAAYQVKVASRQLKALIAKATTPQAIGLAGSDIARMVQRSAPLAQTLGEADFGNNFTTKWNLLTQKITADPTSKDVPKIRRELYNMADELDKSASPFIANQLDDMEEHEFAVSAATRKRQMGETLPDIPFIDLSSQSTPTNATANGSGTYSDPAKEQRYQEYLRKTRGQ